MEYQTFQPQKDLSEFVKIERSQEAIAVEGLKFLRKHVKGNPMHL